MITLGSTYRDSITGFQGVATGYVTYISGCNQVLLAPRVSTDNAMRDAHWFDEQRLQAVEADRIVLDNGDHPGHDMAAPVR